MLFMDGVLTSDEERAWNGALIHLGREWRKSMIHYEPEGLHDITKAVYALWRGPKDEEVGEEIAKMLRRG